MKLSSDQIKKLQANPEYVRNICILAHVDHGKTSLSDSLLASNGVISQRLVGKIRYLDSREDEQLRGITMESSAISLFFKTINKEKVISEYLINLIDSPGHVDFSSEVSTASRLCDGAVVLVDVVEGVCSQTVNVLRQCWVDKLKPVLVLNKIDRLIVELQLTPLEAYLHLSKLIEQVNSVLGSFFAGERMQDDMIYREKMEEAGAGNMDEYVERNDDDLYFDPLKNNVIFASAIDGWGFNISQFVSIFEKKGFKKEVLQKVLWGSFFMDPKTKKIINAAKGRNLKPLFVSLILDNIWAIYENSVLNKNQEKLAKIIEVLNLKVLPRDLRSKDNKNLLQTIFNQWLPVSTAILLTVIEKLPSPLTSQKERIPIILDSAPNSHLIDAKLKQNMLECDHSGALSAYVSKMISIPETELPKETNAVSLTSDEMMERSRKAREAALKLSEQVRKLEEEKKEAELSNNVSTMTINGVDWENYDYEEENTAPKEVPKEVLIGFARIYSGTIKKGQMVSVIGPKFDPKNPEEHITSTEITDLYLLMGRELIPLDEVPAGNIVGIGGLAGKILKNGTLIQPEILGANLAGVNLDTPPIVRVAIEPVNPIEMDQLSEGLRLLNQADPCVETYLQENGEHILICAGELHLERCLKDLKERFANIELSVSKPVIPFRETIVGKDMNTPKNVELGRGNVEWVSESLTIKIHVRPLPLQVTEYLLENNDIITDYVINGKTSVKTHLVKGLNEALDGVKDKENWENLAEKIIAFGGKRTGSNVLVDNTNVLNHLFSEDKQLNRVNYENNLLNGFQLATNEGPLASEPVQGIAVFINEIVVNPDVEFKYGKLITGFKDSVHQAFLDWSPRLMLAMYSCDIQASAEVLGKVYGVVQQRGGYIISEEMKEGTPFFSIFSKIPIVEAFGFAEDIRKKTSGGASPQLIFSGYEVLDQDPYWVPTTEEELEELGEFADRENIARKYMNQIRTRKGLFVDEKVVKNAEKQRTLKRN